MKSKVVLGAYLVKGKKTKVGKRDVLVLSAVDEADVTVQRPPKKIIIDRAAEGKIQQMVETAVNNYIDALPYPDYLAAIVHKTHCHGVPLREQYKFLGARRGQVMAPDPATEEVKDALVAVADARGVRCLPARELKGEALVAAEDFFGRAAIGYTDATEKRSLMLAFGIKNLSFAKRIDQLEKRQIAAATRAKRAAKKAA